MKQELLEKNYKILEHFGIDRQIIIWIEELSELTKELCKRSRKGCFTVESLRNTELEVTDVQVCLDQIKKAINYSLKQQEEDYNFKVNRQLKIIKGEGNE